MAGSEMSSETSEAKKKKKRWPLRGSEGLLSIQGMAGQAKGHRSMWTTHLGMGKRSETQGRGYNFKPLLIHNKPYNQNLITKIITYY